VPAEASEQLDFELPVQQEEVFLLSRDVPRSSMVVHLVLASHLFRSPATMKKRRTSSRNGSSACSVMSAH
jgi:hypothetical protein